MFLLTERERRRRGGTLTLLRGSTRTLSSFSSSSCSFSPVGIHTASFSFSFGLFLWHGSCAQNVMMRQSAGHFLRTMNSLSFDLGFLLEIHGDQKAPLCSVQDTFWLIAFMYSLGTSQKASPRGVPIHCPRQREVLSRGKENFLKDTVPSFPASPFFFLLLLFRKPRVGGWR